MKRIPDKSVDCIICDLPYGTTQLAWDKIIPFEPLWEQYKRITKENAAIILFSSQPFTTDLICSNRKMFKYEIIWDKITKTNFYDAKKRPMKQHENILIFYRKQPTYNPQKDYNPYKNTGRLRANSDFNKTSGNFVGPVSIKKAGSYRYKEDGFTYPGTIVTCSNWNNALFGKTRKQYTHPTQKPVQLLQWLIRSYSNEGDIILDNCMGSGTTAVACIREKRHFIGFEINKEYFDMANERIKEELANPTLL